MKIQKEPRQKYTDEQLDDLIEEDIFKLMKMNYENAARSYATKRGNK